MVVIFFFSKQKLQEEKKRAEYEEMLQKRQEYKEKTKGALVFSDMPSEKKPPKGKGRKQGDIISESGSEGEPRSPSENPKR